MAVPFKIRMVCILVFCVHTLIAFQPSRHHLDCAYAQPSMYSIPLNTKPVTTMPASVASSRVG